LPDTKTLRGFDRKEFDKLPLCVGMTVHGVSITVAPVVKFKPLRFVTMFVDELTPLVGVIPVTDGASKPVTAWVIARIRQKIIR
jgi:hypothetical protein